VQIELIEKKLIELCQEAKSLDRVPISAVVTKDDKIVSYAFNGIKSIEHAEMLALEKAMEHLNEKRLDGCNLYVSLEPCPMCAYAIVLSRIEKVYFFSLDEKNGAVISNINMLERFDTKVRWEYRKNKFFEDILKDFFKSKRA